MTLGDQNIDPQDIRALREVKLQKASNMRPESKHARVQSSNTCRRRGHYKSMTNLWPMSAFKLPIKTSTERNDGFSNVVKCALRTRMSNLVAPALCFDGYFNSLACCDPFQTLGCWEGSGRSAWEVPCRGLPSARLMPYPSV